ncbi:MAG TPA: YicC/YloC family endoribonuclease [Candidatus Rhabdochlamydia sp.]|jgi:uncharacterized protein (TIGR00255 family)|nr:YicC/YloC family endoribonuclease [Candidatus Rhabdochlamydia sp.]
MTAYSRCSKTTSNGSYTLELHSVNRKIIDFAIYLPKDFLQFDIDLRKWLAQELERGQITVRLLMQQNNIKADSNYLLQLKETKEKWENISHELGYDSKTIDFSFVVSHFSPPIYLNQAEEEKIKTFLFELTQEGLKQLLKMKCKEGEAIQIDLQNRLKSIEGALQKIHQKKELPVDRYRKRILRVLEAYQANSPDLVEKAGREVAIFAEKMDIAEELMRLETHIVHFHNYLVSSEKAVGKILEFLIQEMQREINTLGSKASDSEIIPLVIYIKSELEKMKEQIQNIE